MKPMIWPSIATADSLLDDCRVPLTTYHLMRYKPRSPQPMGVHLPVLLKIQLAGTPSRSLSARWVANPGRRGTGRRVLSPPVNTKDAKNDCKNHPRAHDRKPAGLVAHASIRRCLSQQYPLVRVVGLGHTQKLLQPLI